MRPGTLEQSPTSLHAFTALLPGRTTLLSSPDRRCSRGDLHCHRGRTPARSHGFECTVTGAIARGDDAPDRRRETGGRRRVPQGHLRVL